MRDVRAAAKRLLNFCWPVDLLPIFYVLVYRIQQQRRYFYPAVGTLSQFRKHVSVTFGVYRFISVLGRVGPSIDRVRCRTWEIATDRRPNGNRLQLETKRCRKTLRTQQPIYDFFLWCGPDGRGAWVTPKGPKYWGSKGQSLRPETLRSGVAVLGKGLTSGECPNRRMLQWDRLIEAWPWTSCWSAPSSATRHGLGEGYSPIIPPSPLSKCAKSFNTFLCYRLFGMFHIFMFHVLNLL